MLMQKLMSFCEGHIEICQNAQAVPSLGRGLATARLREFHGTAIGYYSKSDAWKEAIVQQVCCY